MKNGWKGSGEREVDFRSKLRRGGGTPDVMLPVSGSARALAPAFWVDVVLYMDKNV